MDRLDDMSEVEGAYPSAKACMLLGPKPWIRPPPFFLCRFASITTVSCTA